MKSSRALIEAVALCRAAAALVCSRAGTFSDHQLTVTVAVLSRSGNHEKPGVLSLYVKATRVVGQNAVDVVVLEDRLLP